MGICYNVIRGDLMHQSSAQIFRANLEMLLAQNGSYDRLAQELNVPASTLKSWINGQRSPSLKALDSLADRLGCHSFRLIMPNASLQNQGVCHNDAHTALVRNLGIIFICHHCYSNAQKLSLLNHQITEFALVSYLRNNDYRLPTLSKLDQIAALLKHPPYELLKSSGMKSRGD